MKLLRPKNEGDYRRDTHRRLRRAAILDAIVLIEGERIEVAGSIDSVTVPQNLETLDVDCADFQAAWNAMAGVTTSQMRAWRQEAQRFIMELMYKNGDGPRSYRNLT